MGTKIFTGKSKGWDGNLNDDQLNSVECSDAHTVQLQLKNALYYDNVVKGQVLDKKYIEARQRLTIT